MTTMPAPTLYEIRFFWEDVLPCKLAYGLTEEEVLDRYPRFIGTRGKQAKRPATVSLDPEDYILASNCS